MKKSKNKVLLSWHFENASSFLKLLSENVGFSTFTKIKKDCVKVKLQR